MAKFCKYCGKELKTKEKCTCKNQETSKEIEKDSTEFQKAKETIAKEVSESGKKYTKQILETSQKIITNPKETIETYFKNSDFNITMIILILTSILIGISTVSFLKGFFITNYTSWYKTPSWDISYFKILSCVSLGVFISYILLAIIFDLGFEKISKTNLTFKKTLTIIAISALEPTIYCVFGAFLTIISYKLAFIMIIYAGILYLINLYQHLKENSNIVSNHYNHLFGILIIIFLFLAIYLIPQLFI